MKLILENVDLKHRELFLEMAKVLKFNLVSVELTEEEEDRAMIRAIEEGKKEGRADQEVQENFEAWLKTL